MPSGEKYLELRRLISENSLHTVCQEANCPNIGECFSKRTATFMILGDTCTRNCKYCNVKHGKPLALDPCEAKRVAKAVKTLGLHYAVITSVTRDDLPDGGAFVFGEVIREIRARSPSCKIEVLIPDFQGDKDALDVVLEAKPDILNHNLETVKRLFPGARPHGDYKRSLALLARAKRSCKTKSGLMVGLGETKEEIIEAIEDLNRVSDIITLGQYLQPSKDHLGVVKYYSPEEFNELKAIGENMGFRHVEAGPLVRSSYHAGEYGL